MAPVSSPLTVQGRAGMPRKEDALILFSLLEPHPRDTDVPQEKGRGGMRPRSASTKEPRGERGRDSCNQKMTPSSAIPFAQETFFVKLKEWTPTGRVARVSFLCCR